MEAIRNHEDHYTFLPDESDGHPCAISGLYPVTSYSGKGKAHDIHPVVYRRIYDRPPGVDAKDAVVNDALENRLLVPGKLRLPPGLNDTTLKFFRSVDEDDDSSPEDRIEATRAKAALGNRNRWAVICMDGNDMGRQFQTLGETDHENLKIETRASNMSSALDRCAHAATLSGLQQVLKYWGEDAKRIQAATYSWDDCKKTILPVRPLAVGGDDIIVLCHVSYAMDFVLEASRIFSEHSEKLNIDGDLWPATGGKLSISAGILYCPVSLPLHSAIQYTELLLASAKNKGRESKQDNAPSPACIDWENVTDGMLETPSARRKRDLLFIDGELSDDDPEGVSVSLTERPYRIEDIPTLLEDCDRYSQYPTSIWQQVLPGLSQPYFDRQMFLAKLGKNYPELAKDLKEDLKPDKNGRFGKSKWRQIDTIRTTPVVDAIKILEERGRMQNKTVKSDQG